MGCEPGAPNMPAPAGDLKSAKLTDTNGNPITGFCLRRDRDFYTVAEMNEHNANEMAACTVFQRLKGTGCMPPVLEALLETDDRLDDDEEKS